MNEARQRVFNLSVSVWRRQSALARRGGVAAFAVFCQFLFHYPVLIQLLFQFLFQFLFTVLLAGPQETSFL